MNDKLKFRCFHKWEIIRARDDFVLFGLIPLLVINNSFAICRKCGEVLTKGAKNE